MLIAITVAMALISVPINELRMTTPSLVRAGKYHSYNKKVVVCGDSIDKNGIFLLVRDRVGENISSMAIDPRAKQFLIENKICVKGIVKRRDGLTPKRAQKLGKSYIIVDSEFDPQYIIRP